MPQGCVLPQASELLKSAFKKGDIKISTLYNMSSKQRVELFEKYVGSSAKLLNSRLEKAFLSPNQKLAVRNWIYKNIGEGTPLYKDLTYEQSKKLRDNLKMSNLRLMDSQTRKKELEKYIEPKLAETLNERFDALKKTGNLQIWEAKALGTDMILQEKKLKGALARLELLDDLGVLTVRQLKDFMESFVEIETGVALTMEETQKLSDLIQEERSAFDKLIEKNDWTYTNEKEVISYFEKLRNIEDYVESLKPTMKSDAINNAIDYARASILASPRILKNSFLYQIIPALERTIAKRVVSGNMSDGDLKSNLMEKIMSKFSAVKPDAETAEFIKNQTAMAVKIYHKTGYDISRMETINDGYKFFGEEVSGLKGKGILGKWAKFVNLAPKWFAGGTDMLFANVGRADTSTLLAREIASMEARKGTLPRGMTEKERSLQLLKDSYSFSPQIDQAQKIREIAILDAHMMNGTQKDGLADFAVKLRDLLHLEKIKFGKVLIPFAKIPATVISEGIKTATGYGIIKSLSMIRSASRLKGIERSTKMQIAVGRLVRYTGLLGASLLIAGLLDDDDYIPPYDAMEYSRRQIAKARGANPGMIRIGGKWFSLNYLPIIGIPLSAIMMSRQAKSKNQNEFAGYLNGVLSSGLLSIPGLGELNDLYSSGLESVKESDVSAILEKSGFDSKSIWEWAKVRAIPSVLSNDLYNAIFPPDKKYDFLGREIEKTGMLDLVRDDKTIETISEFERLDKSGYLPSISEPSGDYAKELKEKIGEKEYYAQLSELQKNYSDNVSREIKLPAYKRKTDEEKKKDIDKIREKSILDELKRINKITK